MQSKETGAEGASDFFENADRPLNLVALNWGYYCDEGVIFITREDETGVANIIVWRALYERFRRAVIAGRLLRITGKLQREGSVSHLIAGRIEDLSPWLDRLGMAPGTANAAKHPAQPRARHPREQARRLFPSRDFH